MCHHLVRPQEWRRGVDRRPGLETHLLQGREYLANILMRLGHGALSQSVYFLAVVVHNHVSICHMYHMGIVNERRHSRGVRGSRGDDSPSPIPFPGP